MCVCIHVGKTKCKMFIAPGSPIRYFPLEFNSCGNAGSSFYVGTGRFEVN